VGWRDSGNGVVWASKQGELEEVMSPRNTSQPIRPSRKPLRQVNKHDEQPLERSTRIDQRTLFIQAHLTREYFSPYAPRR
jgi:hypothetical protein